MNLVFHHHFISQNFLKDYTELLQLLLEMSINDKYIVFYKYVFFH